ncbi:MAG: hypothetical protein U1E76_00755 [Planctomycetota bacterium]
MNSWLDHAILSLIFATGGVVYVGFFALIAYVAIALQARLDRQRGIGAAAGVHRTDRGALDRDDRDR